MKILCSLWFLIAHSAITTQLYQSFTCEANVTALVNVTLHSGLLHSFRLQGLSLSHLQRDGRTVAASGSGDHLSVAAPFCFPEPRLSSLSPGDNKNAAQCSVLPNVVH